MSGEGSDREDRQRYLRIAIAAVAGVFALLAGFHLFVAGLLGDGLASKTIPDLLVLVWVGYFFVLVVSRERSRRREVEALARREARRNSELAMMLRLSRTVGEAVNVEGVAAAVGGAINGTIYISGGEILLWEEDVRELRLGARWGRAASELGLGQGIQVEGDFPSRMAEALEPFIKSDVSVVSRSSGGEVAAAGQACIEYLPLIVQGRALGAMGIVFEDREALRDGLEVVRAATSEVALAVGNAQMYERLRDDAITDELTGLRNRRYLLTRMEEEVARSKRYGLSLSVVLADWDSLKRINDELGHVAGDTLLAQAAEKLRLSARRSDVVSRYGGDEFVILLPDTDADGAAEMAERTRRVFESWEPEIDGKKVKITFSLGVATDAEQQATVDELLRWADEAMYRAKAGGGNRVSC